jgi:hypothetical protein
MYELKKIGKVFTSKFVGTGPSSYEKKNLPGHSLTKVEKHCCIAFVWRVALFYTFLINVTTFLVFTFTVLNILLSCNWVNLVFSVLFRTMEVGYLPDTFTYHAGMLHIVIMVKH